jgi:Tat protein secretion system quality control protein TatD with DNase activity
LFQHAKNRPGVAAVITGCEYGKAPHGEMEPVAISEDQEAAFLVACEVALEWQVPLVVTLRPDAREEELNLEAVNDCLAWLDKAQVPQSWPIHFASWGGPPGLALRVLKKYPRAMLGLNGALSFRSASHLRELAFDIPLDRILLESDAPSNSPADLAFPHSPWTVLMLVDIVAAQKRLPKEAVNDAVVANAGRLYSRSVARPVPEGFQMVVDAQEHATNASREPKDLEDLNELGKFL